MKKFFIKFFNKFFSKPFKHFTFKFFKIEMSKFKFSTLTYLTNVYKKRIIRKDGVLSLLSTIKKLFVEKIKTITKKCSSLFDFSPPSGRKEPEMKTSRFSFSVDQLIDYVTDRRFITAIALVATAVVVTACGGGDMTNNQAVSEKSFSETAIAHTSSSASKDAKKVALSVKQSQAVSSPYGDQIAGVAIEQLLNFAEENYKQFFGSKEETLLYQKFRYRYYPENGTYVGVASSVTEGDGLVEGGVYVMGGTFGATPTYVGQLTSFITPFDWKKMVKVVPMGTTLYLNSEVAPSGAVVNTTFPGQSKSGWLPPECRKLNEDCFKEASANGTVKYVETTARDPYDPTTPVVFAVYRTPSVIMPGLITTCRRVHNGNTFEFDYNNTVTVEAFCSAGDEDDLIYIRGNEEGVESKIKNQGCYQMYIVGGGWYSRKIECTQ